MHLILPTRGDSLRGSSESAAVRNLDFRGWVLLTSFVSLTHHTHEQKIQKAVFWTCQMSTILEETDAKVKWVHKNCQVICKVHPRDPSHASPVMWLDRRRLALHKAFTDTVTDNSPPRLSFVNRVKIWQIGKLKSGDFASALSPLVQPFPLSNFQISFEWNTDSI